MSDVDEIFVRLLDRDFDINKYALDVTLTPRKFSIDALGGYDTAEIEIEGPIESMFAIAQMLRSGVELYDKGGNTVWRGIIWSVELPWGQRIIGRSLEMAANTVQVAYNTPEGTVGRTAWATDTRHIARYGVKELVGDLSDSTEEQANVYRNTLLAMRSVWPAPKIVSRPVSNTIVTGTMVCIGLYKTLDWQYYTNAEMGLDRMTDKDESEIAYTDSYEGPAGVEDATIQFGDTTGQSQVYFVFTSNATHPAELSKVEFKLVKVGAPADVFLVDLVLDSAGTPGTILNTVQINASALSTSHTWQTFSVRAILLPGVVYGFRLRRSGAVDAANYFRAASHTALGYTNGASYRNSVGTWVLQTSDIFFRFDAKSTPLIDIAAVSARTSFAQQFTLDEATADYGIVSVTISAMKVGTPGGDLRVQVWTNSAGAPGTVIGAATIPQTLVNASLSDIAFSFGVGQVAQVAPGTAMWIAVSRIGGGIDAANYYLIEANLTPPTWVQDMKHWNGSAWAALSLYKWSPYRVTYGVESIEQVKRIAAACGQFFSALDMRVSSGVFVPAFASGDSTGLTLINEIMAIGTSGGGRLNAQVTNEDRFQVYAEAVLDADAWYEDEAGNVRTRYGTEVPQDMTVGVWVVPLNLPGGEVPEDWAHFIERTEWSDGAITRTSRDTRDALDVFGVQGE